MSAAEVFSLHFARQVKANPQLAYLVGPGSRTWELLVEAFADLTHQTTAQASAHLLADLKTTPVRAEPVEAPRDAGDDLRQGVSRTAHEVLDLIEREKPCWDLCYTAFGLVESGHDHASTANRSAKPASKRAIAIEAAARLIHAAERLAQ